MYESHPTWILTFQKTEVSQLNKTEKTYEN